MCWKSVIEPSLFSDGVMGSAYDFYLLGESVPQVRVSPRALALLGFLNSIYSDSLISSVYIYIHINRNEEEIY